MGAPTGVLTVVILLSLELVFDIMRFVEEVQLRFLPGFRTRCELVADEFVIVDSQANPSWLIGQGSLGA